MLNNRRNIILILISIAFLATIFGSAYFVAITKTQPQYTSKIAEIMFNTKNKPPKFLLNISKKEIEKKIEPVKKIRTTDEILQNIPAFIKLTKQKSKKSMEVVSKDKTAMPWLNYAKSFELPQNFYKISVIIKNVGLSKKAMDAIIETMPENIAISFCPYTHDIETNVKKVRSAGHETYLDLLLSPKDVFSADNGPKSLKITSSIEENIKKIEDSVNQNIAIGGLITSKGLADISTPERLSKLLETIKKQGLLFIDASEDIGFEAVKTTGLPRGIADVVIEKAFNLDNIHNQFIIAENAAKQKGSAIVVVEPKPIILAELIKWIATFSQPVTEQSNIEEVSLPEKPFVLAPLSSVVVE